MIILISVDDLKQVIKKIDYKYRVVTLDGEILHVGGSLTGGSIKTRNIITDRYELENSLRLQEKYEDEQKNIENEINRIDYELKAVEDKLYLANKEKISIVETINSRKNTIKEINNRLESITDEINTSTSTLNKTIENDEEMILKEYYQAQDQKSKIESELEILNNNKTKLSNELDDFEFSVKKDNSLYNEKTNLLHSLEIEVNRADVKLDNLLNILNETYSITYENAIKLYKLDMDSNLARNKVNSLKRKIRELGPVNEMAPSEYERVSERYEFLIHQQEDLSKAETTLLEIINEMDIVMKKEFINTFKIFIYFIIYF